MLVGPTRGHRFSPRGARGSIAVALGRYEWTVARFLRDHLIDARRFFDVGANTGYFTRLALRTMRDGVVVAFEPDPAWHEALSSLDPRRVELRPEAVGGTDGRGRLVSVPDACSRLESALPDTTAQTTSASIIVRSLDGLLDEGVLRSPDAVKIDVEGSELDVITGAERTLATARTLVVECHSMPLFRDVLDRVIDSGFDRIQTTRGGDGLGPPTILASRS